MLKRIKLLYASALIAAFCMQALDGQVYPKHEMRAIWIATVNNIDWPSLPGLTAEQQKREITELLDLVNSYNLNTVVFQIRPAADAFYNSSLEPWSQWLSGKQGIKPEPFYDPLEFAISECRKRGLDIHAWLNPYRAVTDTANVTDSTHITNLHPDWFLTYGKTVYFDPGLPQTREHVARVVGDIVRRYDIDAVHMDDYFYPYRIAKLDFPDDSSFSIYRGEFTNEQRDDWRRENVNLIIKQLSDTIKSIKPWVEFGISPFGVWRNSEKDPSGSATRAGQTNYDDLFADILLWQKEGWIDYITPQIYWQIGFGLADYSVLAEWWSRNNFGASLYIGQAPYRIARKATVKEWRTSKEIIRQVKLNRNYPNIGGSMYFSAKVLRRNPLRLKERLLKELYQHIALPPENSRIEPVTPGLPSDATVTVTGGNITLSWKPGKDNKKFVVYRFSREKAATTEDASAILEVTSDNRVVIPLTVKSDPSKFFYVVSSVSPTNRESMPVYFISTDSRR
jgi:uncharacterized lipoprotein YddW (UPF0748 family)